MNEKKNIDIKDLVKELSSLTILEASDLAKALEEEWGVSAAMLSAAQPSSNTSVADKEDSGPAEKTDFDVKMIAFGEKKLEVIRTIRSVLGLGLKESKELVEKAPVEIKKSVDKAEAEEIKSKLEAAGAQIELI